MVIVQLIQVVDIILIVVGQTILVKKTIARTKTVLAIIRMDPLVEGVMIV